MSNDPSPESLRPSVRDYGTLALIALLVLAVLLVAMGFGAWSLLPLLVGTFGILLPGSIAPGVVLFSLLSLFGVRLMIARGDVSELQQTPLILDLFLPAITLIYVVAHSRLLALTTHALPADHRREQRTLNWRLVGRWLLPGRVFRTGDDVTNEIAWLLLSMPGFLLVTYFLWWRLAIESPPVDFLDDLPDILGSKIGIWRILVLMWAGMIALFGWYALLGYLRRRLMSREQAMLLVQDELWKQTRGEQRRIWSCLTWWRLRRQRKQERIS